DELLPDGALTAYIPAGCWRFLSQAAQALFMWSTLLAIFGYGRAYLDRPLPWLPYASEAVYPWYILHQSVMIVIAYNLIPLHVGPIAEPLLVIAGTVGGCLALQEFVIRRVAVLRPLFGLKREPRPRVRVPLAIVHADTN
ncbi:MAG TPA: acyltransferase, partial [Rudaea sp.]